MTTKIAMVAADVALLTTLLSPSLLGLKSGLVFDGANLIVPDGALATAVNAAMADPNWRATASKVQLSAYAAGARYNKEVGGTTIGGVAYATDRDTQAALNGAYSLSVVNPNLSVSWKLPDGSFATLNAQQIVAVATAVGNFVQQCFATEAAVNVGINASPPTITTTAQIDAQFAAFS